jgi:hypothetical protein
MTEKNITESKKKKIVIIGRDVGKFTFTKGNITY